MSGTQEALREWQPIETAPRDGRTIEMRGTMFVHHMQGAKFAIMPRDWRPETPQTEWRFTHWREAPPPSDVAVIEVVRPMVGSDSTPKAPA